MLVRVNENIAAETGLQDSFKAVNHRKKKKV